MKCSDFLNELNEFLDGSADPELMSELKEHMTWCYNCRVVLDTTRHTIQIYKENQTYDLPDNVRSRLQTAILDKCRRLKQQS